MAMFGMNNEKKTLLIREVHQRPLIWKTTDPRYSDIPARWLAFEEIARELSDDELIFTSDMIKMAWRNMMDYYNHIRRARERAIDAGSQPPDTKWQFYHLLHFIRQDKPPAKRRYNRMEPSKIGEHVAMRLFKIKDKSFFDYYRIRDMIEKLLGDAETALNIV